MNESNVSFLLVLHSELLLLASWDVVRLPNQEVHDSECVVSLYVPIGHFLHLSDPSTAESQ